MNTIKEDNCAQDDWFESHRLPLKRRIGDVINGGFSAYRLAVEAGVRRQDLLDWIERDAEGAPELIESLESWLESEKRNAPTDMTPDNPGWVETPTAVKIIDALDYARYTPTISVVYGGAGVGKTTTLRHYAKTRPRTWVVTAAVARRTTSAILMALVESPSLRGFAYRVDSLFNEALAFMGRSSYDDRGVNGLLIIDEAQHLETPVFDAIRAFYDEAGIGIAYVGNEEVYSRIHGKKRSRLPQVFSRVGMRVRVERSTPEDADAFLEAHGISGREERKYAQLIAATPGGLRSLNHVIHSAKLVALENNLPITVGLLKAAAIQCGIEG
jgi:DNA transposition AAA+ family ATPase